MSARLKYARGISIERVINNEKYLLLINFNIENNLNIIIIIFKKCYDPQKTELLFNYTFLISLANKIPRPASLQPPSGNHVTHQCIRASIVSLKILDW